MNLQGITVAIQRLEQAATEYEAYEYALQRPHCEEVGQALGDLLVNLANVDVQATPEKAAALAALQKTTVEVRMKNAAYIPHCQSQAITYLKKRGQLAEAFRVLAKEAKQ